MGLLFLRPQLPAAGTRREKPTKENHSVLTASLRVGRLITLTLVPAVVIPVKTQRNL